FGSIPPGPPVGQIDDWVPELPRHLREVMQDRVPQSRIYRVWHAPGWGEEELIHLQLFASVLSGSKSAPLDRAMVYDKELATDVTAFVWEKEIASNFAWIATVKPEAEVAEAEAEAQAVLEGLIDRGPTKEELQRAQTRILAGFVKGMERLGGFGGRSDILAESMTFGESPDAYLDILEMVAEATPSEVQAAARKWLTRPHYTMTVNPYPEYKAAESDLDRSILPDIGHAPDVEFPEVQRAELDNGLEVILLERHSAPLVNMALAVDAGYASDPSGSEGLSSLAIGLMDDGTTSRDAFEIVDELDALGADVFTGNSLDQSFVRLRALKMNLVGAAEVYADVIRNPSFPEEMVALEKKRTIAGIAQEKATPNAAALRILPRLVYPESHAYSAPFTGSGYERTVSGFERDDLRAWHERWFAPSNATIIVTGDVTMEELLPVLEGTLGSWEGGEAPRKDLAKVETVSTGKVFLIDKPDAPQSVITAAHVTRPGGDPRDLALEIVMRNFGGMSTSRLNRNLRLDKHWSYGAWGQVFDARGQRPFLVIAPVQTDKTKEAIVEVMNEIRGVAGERPIEGEEYESIMRNMTLRLPGRFETLSSLESAAIDLVNYGLPSTYFANYAQSVRELTEEDVAKAGSAFVDPDDLVWLIVGDLEEIEAGVRALELGEIVRLDSDGNVTE
ncbi:MAG: insulinase family protein, partial [Thermoanaerobaculia bacterium]|nr:insulinase family protein [Thermoanaerobaculia bacterium]